MCKFGAKGNRCKCLTWRTVLAIWLWLKKPLPKWNPGKWKHGYQHLRKPPLFNFEPQPSAHEYWQTLHVLGLRPCEAPDVPLGSPAMQLTIHGATLQGPKAPRATVCHGVPRCATVCYAVEMNSGTRLRAHSRHSPSQICSGQVERRPTIVR